MNAHDYLEGVYRATRRFYGLNNITPFTVLDIAAHGLKPGEVDPEELRNAWKTLFPSYRPTQYMEAQIELALSRISDTAVNTQAQPVSAKGE